MPGRQSDQRGLWEAASQHLDHMGRASFYGLLASMRGKLVRAEDFAELFCADNGRGERATEPSGNRACAPDKR